MATTPRKSAAKPAAKAGKATAKAPAAKKTTTPAKPQRQTLTPFQAWHTPDSDRAMAELCDHITAGGHLAEFAKARGFSYTSMRRWIDDDAAGRAAMYARAREERADKLADEIVAIADELDVQAKHDGEDVTLVLDAAAIQRNRLRVDARKWVASKLKPRTYGEKLDVTQQVTIKDVPDDELTRRAAEILAMVTTPAK